MRNCILSSTRIAIHAMRRNRGTTAFQAWRDSGPMAQPITLPLGWARWTVRRWPAFGILDRGRRRRRNAVNIRCEDYDHVTVIGITGEFTADTTDTFRKQIAERLERKVRFFVVDLAQVTFLDSKGLESLL